MGSTGAGKSSVALHLAATGAWFMSDDVSALELRAGDVLAHPGGAVASVDSRELDRMAPEAAGRWERLGEHDGEVRVGIGRDGPPDGLPVAAVYVLSRRAQAASLEGRLPCVGSPELLLSGTFNAYVDTPDRLIRQLEVCGRLAETATLMKVTVPPGVHAGEVADALARRHETGT